MAINKNDLINYLIWLMLMPLWYIIIMNLSKSYLPKTYYKNGQPKIITGWVMGMLVLVLGKVCANLLTNIYLK
jgi:hypothetical protein